MFGSVIRDGRNAGQNEASCACVHKQVGQRCLGRGVGGEAVPHFFSGSFPSPTLAVICTLFSSRSKDEGGIRQQKIQH